MTRSRLRTLLSAFQILAALPALVGLLVAVNAVGMQVGFIGRISVTNPLPYPVAVTAVGVWHGTTQSSVLPQFLSALPAVPAPRGTDIVVRPGQTLTLLYDSDDINPTELHLSGPPGARWSQPLPTPLTLPAAVTLTAPPVPAPAAPPLPADGNPGTFYFSALSVLALVLWCLADYARRRIARPPAVAPAA